MRFEQNKKNPYIYRFCPVELLKELFLEKSAPNSQFLTHWPLSGSLINLQNDFFLNSILDSL